MLLIFLATAMWTVAILGLGSLLRIPALTSLTVPVAGFGGLFALTVLASWASLASPLTSELSAAVALVGLAGAWLNRRLLFSRRDLLVGGCVLAVLAALTQFPDRQYDTGLYHLQAVKWARFAAVQPGLAHLHERLGFNSSWFVLAALLEAPGLSGRSAFVLSALPVVFTVLAVAGLTSRLRSGDRSLGTIFLAFAAVPATFGVAALASLAPDPVVGLLTFLSLGLWALGLDRPAELPRAALIATATAAWAFTIKLSAAPIVLGSALLLALNWRGVGGRAVVRLAAVVALLWVPWLARGVVTSGCAAYPAAPSCLASLSWVVPAHEAEHVAEVIGWWARTPGVDPQPATPFAQWFWPWVARLRWDPIAHVCIPLFLTGGAVAVRRGARPPRTFWALFVVAMGGLIFWFQTAPDLRFASGYLFTVALLPWALVGSVRAPGRGARPPLLTTRRTTLLAAALVAGSLLVANPWMRRLGSSGTNGLLTWPKFPSPALVARATPSGRTLYTPVGTDQCWDAPLPCAPGLPPAGTPEWWAHGGDR